MLRNQLAPAFLLLMFYACRKHWRNRWLPMIAGVLPSVALFGIVDWITWSYPFQSVYTIFHSNLVQHKAAQFGVEPFNFYVRKWLTFLGPMVLFSVIGAVTVRRAKILAYLVLAIVIPHSFIAHKEVRYIYPALPLMLILAGFGIWQCALWLRDTRSKPIWASVTVMLLIAAGTTTAFNLSKMGWRHDEGSLRSMQLLSHTSDACGVALYGLDWSESGGYAYLHRDIPIFQTTLEYPYKPISPAAEKNIQHWMNFNEMSPAFNYVIASQPLTYGDYRTLQCWSGVCLYKRPGGCAKIPDYSISELLRSMNR